MSLANCLVKKNETKFNDSEMSGKFLNLNFPTPTNQSMKQEKIASCEISNR